MSEFTDEEKGLIRTGLNNLIRRLERQRDEKGVSIPEQGAYDAQIRKVWAVKRKLDNQGETE